MKLMLLAFSVGMLNCCTMFKNVMAKPLAHSFYVIERCFIFLIKLVITEA